MKSGAPFICVSLILMTVWQIRQRLRQFANKKKAQTLQGFFKTAPGEYGEGDKFLGIVVPVIRRVAREFREAPVSEVQKMVRSLYHEERLLALLMLVQTFSKSEAAVQKNIYDIYLKNMRYINSWDLVDLSAPNIVGAYLAGKSRKLLYNLARSRDVWKRRAAIMATFYLIKQNEFKETLKISEMLLTDDHYLIHKAVGWMLREVGKRDLRIEEQFLQQHYKKMPRTMLRYSIERFPEEKRLCYLDDTA